MRPRELIKQYADKRGVQVLYHFTRIENLESILKWGILSKAELTKRKITFQENDSNRYDKLLDFTSFSVSFPNYKMLHTLRSRKPSNEYILLEFPVDLISEKWCYFFPDNATKRKDFTHRDGFSHLMGMFEFSEDSRSKTGIPYNYPTNPEAEILIVGHIDANKIVRIIFDKAESLFRYQQIVSIRPKLVFDRSYFGPRMDYKFWQKI